MEQADVIFVRVGAQLRPIARSEYASEELLQLLLQQHPALLSGEQLRPGDPIRWLFVAREAGIADGEGSNDRWSLDHLFLDQDGVPTLVEVKRSTDTRIRREVVGQMLDYAANATLWWPPRRIRELALRQHGSEAALCAAVALLAGVGTDDVDAIETYWAGVDRNLAAGRLRLLFVADRIPGELRRIIEFLNAHMPLIEVLGVEIAQYKEGNDEAFVPRVVGQTQAASDARQPPKAKTTAAAFLAECPPEFHHSFEALLSGAQARGLMVNWGGKGFSVRVNVAGKPASLFYGYPAGALGMAFPVMQAYVGQLPADSQESTRRRFLAAAPFKKSGEFSLNLSLEPGRAAEADRAVAALWAVTDSLQAAIAAGRALLDSLEPQLEPLVRGDWDSQGLLESGWVAGIEDDDHGAIYVGIDPMARRLYLTAPNGDAVFANLAAERGLAPVRSPHAPEIAEAIWLGSIDGPLPTTAELVALIARWLT